MRRLQPFVFLFAFCIAACSGTDKTSEAAETLILETDNGTFQFTVELALTPEERARGLMYRQELGAENGMLFRYDEPRVVSMWMKNTYIPLDMAFIRPDGVVESIAQNVQPHSLDSVASIGPVRATLEVNAGVFQRIGLKVGDRVAHPWFETGAG
ncbi:MAG: DUF192 domain-containing protein [Pseudomonadota bacterium]